MKKYIVPIVLILFVLVYSVIINHYYEQIINPTNDNVALIED